MNAPQACVACKLPAEELVPHWAELKRCPRCGHCVAEIDLEAFDAKSLYGPGYFKGDAYLDYSKDREVLEKHFKKKLAFVLRHVSGGRLLEIGSAYGFFLNLAKERFEVGGFEISDEAAAYASRTLGLDVRSEAFEAGAVAKESFDCVVMWDVIEHLPRPDLTVKAAAAALRPGGMLFLTTGDIESWLARLRKGKWRLIHPPTHLHYFTRRSLGALLSGVGMQVVECRHTGVRRSLRQMIYSVFQLGRERRSTVFALAERLPIGSLSLEINSRDILQVAARKR
jgi:SAM-dependent methyltransferase